MLGIRRVEPAELCRLLERRHVRHLHDVRTRLRRHDRQRGQIEHAHEHQRRGSHGNQHVIRIEQGRAHALRIAVLQRLRCPRDHHRPRYFVLFRLVSKLDRRGDRLVRRQTPVEVERNFRVRPTPPHGDHGAGEQPDRAGRCHERTHRALA